MTRNRLAVLLAVTIFGLTYGLSSPLIALRLSVAGYSEAFIGINAAMHALGVLLIAPGLPALCRRFSATGLLITSLIAAALLLTLFPFLPLWSSFVLRLLLGMATEVMLVVTETWLNQQSTESNRAKMLATYTAMLSFGFALGPFILTLQGSGTDAFITAASLAALAALTLLASRHLRLNAESSVPHKLSRWLRLLPLALAATLLNAALEAAGMNLLAIYAMNLGWPEAQATSFITILMVGAIVLQLPIGWLADRLDRHRLIIWLAALSTLGALVWPLALQHLWLARLLLFCWGGVFVGIYTVIITLTGQHFQGAELAGAYAALSVAWGVGALLGPALGGVAMSLTVHGLPWLAAILCALFTGFALMQRRRS
ncbi:MAG: MFS transporter [Enterobacterales bacterium endosymbiont of Blomia tropicalis]|uniref:MFS transporter n=1 Tax=Mixta mediterraneensis TaxID=2758443 RepID=UPI0018772E45|nr:MFS transporter [Mixta mediterraneensis]MBE5252318.1 MFS transporter [Mixta mediterraneensis]MDL4913782.1 MFS transporter [Mixta mediterraneensis]